MMWLRSCVVLLLTVAACVVPAGGAQNSKDPIDLGLDRAVAKDPSTAGMRRATQEAARRWDAEMNRAYRRLAAYLRPDDRATLQRSQRAWLAFRDAEFRTIAALTGNKQGTMWGPVSDGQRLQIVKDRALQLRDLASTAEE